MMVRTYASYIDDKVVISLNKSQLENGGMNRQELNILNQKVKQVFICYKRFKYCI